MYVIKYKTEYLQRLDISLYDTYIKYGNIKEAIRFATFQRAFSFVRFIASIKFLKVFDFEIMKE